LRPKGQGVGIWGHLGFQLSYCRGFGLKLPGVGEFWLLGENSPTAGGFNPNSLQWRSGGKL